MKSENPSQTGGSKGLGLCSESWKWMASENDKITRWHGYQIGCIKVFGGEQQICLSTGCSQTQEWSKKLAIVLLAGGRITFNVEFVQSPQS